MNKNEFKVFNEKIDSFRDHEKYKWLRQYADDALRWIGNFGYLQIKAEDFIKRIEKMPCWYILDWLEGRNELDWKERYDMTIEYIEYLGNIYEYIGESEGKLIYQSVNNDSHIKMDYAKMLNNPDIVILKREEV